MTNSALTEFYIEDEKIKLKLIILVYSNVIIVKKNLNFFTL